MEFRFVLWRELNQVTCYITYIVEITEVNGFANSVFVCLKIFGVVVAVLGTVPVVVAGMVVASEVVASVIVLVTTIVVAIVIAVSIAVV